MNMTKVREKIAAIVTVLFILILFCVMAVAFGWNIPIVSDIAAKFGY